MTSRPVFRVKDKVCIASILIIMAVLFSDSCAQATLVVGELDTADRGSKGLWQSGQGVRYDRPSKNIVSVKSVQVPEKSVLRGRYTLKVCEYVIDKEVAEKLLRVRAIGLQPDNMPGPRRMMQMTRLTVGEYLRRAEAGKTLDRLQHSGVNGLIMRGRDNKYRILLGAFADQENAKNKLAHFVSKGIRVNSYRQVVPVPTKILIAGSFKTREEAFKSASKMEYLGVKCSLMEV